VLERLTAFVAAHREMTLSSATSRLVDEALRLGEHPLITFKDGPAGRRARLVGGPDVWEVIVAVHSVRVAEPALAGDEVLAVVAETSGVPMPFLRVAPAYWGDYQRKWMPSSSRSALRPRRRRPAGNGSRNCSADDPADERAGGR
jgi:hypothetical protein